jgi:hypothetical protein
VRMDRRISWTTRSATDAVSTGRTKDAWLSGLVTPLPVLVKRPQAAATGINPVISYSSLEGS